MVGLFISPLLILFYSFLYLVPKVRARRKPRGPTKMSRVHARNPNEIVVISLIKKGQAISDVEEDVAELSNFLGTLARDNVSLTYVNWHVVPEKLKQKLWDYTLVNSILYIRYITF